MLSIVPSRRTWRASPRPARTNGSPVTTTTAVTAARSAARALDPAASTDHGVRGRRHLEEDDEHQRQDQRPAHPPAPCRGRGTARRRRPPRPPPQPGRGRPGTSRPSAAAAATPGDDGGREQPQVRGRATREGPGRHGSVPGAGEPIVRGTTVASRLRSGRGVTASRAESPAVRGAFSPMPLTSPSSSTLVNRPWLVRQSTMRWASTGPDTGQRVEPGEVGGVQRHEPRRPRCPRSAPSAWPAPPVTVTDPEGPGRRAQAPSPARRRRARAPG